MQKNMDQSDVNTEAIRLAEELNMEFSNENGQRVIGPPRDWEGPIPPRGSEIHVGRIPRTVLEPKLLPLFMKAGKIYTFRLMMNFSGDNRGYCFVKYATPEDAENAINMLAGSEVEGKPIRIQLSVENRKIFIRPLPFTITSDEVYQQFSKYFGGITRILLKTWSKNQDIERYGFIEFEDHRHAALARKTLLETSDLFWDQQVYVDWALPVLPQNQPRTLRIINVNPETSTETLKGVLNSYGNNGVVYVRSKTNYVHVKFDNHANAEAVRNKVDGAVIDGSAVRVEWKKLLKRKCAHMKNQKMAKFQKDGQNDGEEQQSMVVPTTIPMVQLINPGLPGLQTLIKPAQVQQVGQVPDGAVNYMEFRPGQPVTMFQNPGALLWSYLQPEQAQVYRHGQPSNSGTPSAVDVYYVSGNQNPVSTPESRQGVNSQQVTGNSVQGYMQSSIGPSAGGQQMLDSQAQIFAPNPVGHRQQFSEGPIQGYYPNPSAQYVFVNQPPQTYSLTQSFSPLGSPLLSPMVPFPFPHSDIGSAVGTLPGYSPMRTI